MESKGQKGAIEQAFHEVYTKTPKTMGKNQTPIQKRKQLIAIALSKAGASNGQK